MISRYNRRPVSHKLEIRGLSRSSLDQHPLPEADGTKSSQRFPHDLQESDSIHNSSETSAASGHSDCPTVISVGSDHSWSGIHSSVGTGVSTERSSVFSWGYDEFDKAASRQVQQMFEEIDKELYEEKGSGGGILLGLQDECQQWATRFPHLRILGTQIVCPRDDGVQWFAASKDSSLYAAIQREVTSSEVDKNSSVLNVQGRKAELVKSSSSELVGPSRTSSCSSNPEKPGVYEVEGQIEEYLAFDCVDQEEVLGQDGSAPRHRSMPPVSPYKCCRQAVLDQLFDDVWRQLVGSMQELVLRQRESFNSSTFSRNFSPLIQDLQDPTVMFSTMPMMLPKVIQNKVPPLAIASQFQNTKTRGKHKSRWKSKKQKRTPSVGRIPAGSAATQNNLNDLIMIQSIPLQQRNLGLLDRTHELEDRLSHRPGSSVVPSNRVRTRRTLDQSSSSLSRPPQSARRRNPPPRTLLPLVPGLSQSSVAASMDEVIRGTRLTTVSDRLTSPLLPLSRNTLLPPISTIQTDSSPSGLQSKHSQRHKGSSSRAHSAINDEVGGSIPRDRQILDIFSRPNTTHTYRSDTPYRRSFTVLDNIGLGRTGRASVATDALGIGVTGISLGISSASFLDSFSHHPLGHLTIHDEDEPDPQAPEPAPLVPTSVPLRSHTRGGLSSRASRPGL